MELKEIKKNNLLFTMRPQELLWIIFIGIPVLIFWVMFVLIMDIWGSPIFTKRFSKKELSNYNEGYDKVYSGKTKHCKKHDITNYGGCHICKGIRDEKNERSRKI